MPSPDASAGCPRYRFCTWVLGFSSPRTPRSAFTPTRSGRPLRKVFALGFYHHPQPHHTPIAFPPAICRILPHSLIPLPTGGFPMMFDWNAYQAALTKSIPEFAKLSPDSLKGYQTLSAANSKTSLLGEKTRQLISL